MQQGEEFQEILVRAFSLLTSTKAAALDEIKYICFGAPKRGKEKERKAHSFNSPSSIVDVNERSIPEPREEKNISFSL